MHLVRIGEKSRAKCTHTWDECSACGIKDQVYGTKAELNGVEAGVKNLPTSGICGQDRGLQGWWLRLRTQKSRARPQTKSRFEALSAS